MEYDSSGIKGKLRNISEGLLSKPDNYCTLG